MKSVCCAVSDAMVLYLMLTVVTYVHEVLAYPSGAGLEACATLTPQHGNLNTPRTDTSPYAVLVSKASYQPGENITVMLRGLCGHTIMGFLVQARRVDTADPRYRTNPNQALGTFSAVPGSKYTCNSVAGESLTHNGRFNGTSLLLSWTAPLRPEGHIQIKATFVEKFESFWTLVTSVVIEDPTATRLPGNPSDLRTKYIEPCDTDKPTTTSTTTATTTTTLATTMAATTPILIPSSATTVLSASTTMAPSSSPMTLQPPLTSVRLETSTLATTPRITPMPVLPSLSTSTSPSTVATSQTPVFQQAMKIQCGQGYGCFRDCGSSVCTFQVAWQPRDQGVWFDVMVRTLSLAQKEWVAVGFSKDHMMGQDSVVECLQDGERNTARASFNGDRTNQVLQSVDKALITEVKIARSDGFLRCQFFRKMTDPDNRVFDLKQDWYLMLAQGLVDNAGEKLQHSGIPFVSAHLVDLQAIDDVRQWPWHDKLFIKIHGAVMAFAWIFCAGLGIVIARYYKPLWPAQKFCGRKVWFTVHRLCMVVMAILTTGGFVIIFIEAGDLAEISVVEFQKLHPVIGIVVTAVTVVQILLGCFRPSSASRNRPVFNWGHLLLGLSCHILAVFNMILGSKLSKARVHVATTYILYAYAVYQVLIAVVLEFITCNMRIKEKKQASYIIYERRNMVYSSTKEILEGESHKPPGSFAMGIMIRIHLLFVTAFSAATIALIVIAR
ncbi:ferric-chelate reductase 1-like isoform X1 [Pomacea canaliculata]|uniref:ferric-chelate reductase 1-like isoform X1 n=1 Tax=Pomacea canaliculata TaxID=400727 RepID=UPI000D73D513|nr:ferric-chelate reductase 1-like isoform X1 [Pomacea canaliculata]